MKKEELDELIRDYVDAPSDEKERVLKDAFRVCLDLMSRTAGKIKSSGLEVHIYDKRWFDIFLSVYDACDGMTDFEIYPMDTERYNVDFNILPSRRFLSVNKRLLCEEFLRGFLKELIDSIKWNYQKDFDIVKKRYDDAASKLLKAKSLDIED